jgi:hypothetical protein
VDEAAKASFLDAVDQPEQEDVRVRDVMVGYMGKRWVEGKD